MKVKYKKGFNTLELNGEDNIIILDEGKVGIEIDGNVPEFAKSKDFTLGIVNFSYIGLKSEKLTFKKKIKMIISIIKCKQLTKKELIKLLNM